MVHARGGRRAGPWPPARRGTAGPASRSPTMTRVLGDAEQQRALGVGVARAQQGVDLERGPARAPRGRRRRSGTRCPRTPTTPGCARPVSTAPSAARHAVLRDGRRCRPACRDAVADARRPRRRRRRWRRLLGDRPWPTASSAGASGLGRAVGPRGAGRPGLERRRRSTAAHAAAARPGAAGRGRRPGCGRCWPPTSTTRRQPAGRPARRWCGYPTGVLRAAGARPVARDEFAAGTSPTTSTPEPGHLRRRRPGPARARPGVGRRPRPRPPRPPGAGERHGASRRRSAPTRPVACRGMSDSTRRHRRRRRRHERRHAGAPARSPTVEIVVLEKGGWTSYSACGIPYVVGGVGRRHRRPGGPHARGVPRATHRRPRSGTRPGRSTSTPAGRGLGPRRGRDGAVGFDQLHVATGARPLRPDLPGIDLPIVHGVQTLDDAAALLDVEVAGRPVRAGVVVVGGGYIGLEMAEAFVQRGAEVTAGRGVATRSCRRSTPTWPRRWPTPLGGLGVDVRLGTSGVERLRATERCTPPAATLAGRPRGPRARASRPTPSWPPTAGLELGRQGRHRRSTGASAPRPRACGPRATAASRSTWCRGRRCTSPSARWPTSRAGWPASTWPAATPRSPACSARR